MTLGERVRQSRKAAGLSAKDLADRIGVTPSMVSHLERDEKSPGLENLKTIASVLGVSTDYLLGRTSDESETTPPPAPSIPLSGEVLPRGDVASEALEQLRGIMARSAPGAFTYPDRLPANGAGPRAFAVTCAISASDKTFGDLRPGDLLVVDPDTAPRSGDLVVATWNTERDEDEEPANLTRLRRLREVEGELEIAPVVPDDRGGSLVVREGEVKIMAVVVGLRRSRH